MITAHVGLSTERGDLEQSALGGSRGEDADHVLDLLGEEGLDHLPALAQGPRRVEHARAAEHLWVVQVSLGTDQRMPHWDG